MKSRGEESENTGCSNANGCSVVHFETSYTGTTSDSSHSIIVQYVPLDVCTFSSTFGSFRTSKGILSLQPDLPTLSC